MSIGVAALALLGAPRAAWATFIPPPAPGGHVATTAGWLSPADLRALDKEAETIHDQTGFVVDVFLVGSLEGESIEAVTDDTFHAWKVGDPGKDNGILLVFAPNFDAGQIRLVEGKGVQDALTAAEAKRILLEISEPRVKADDVRAAVAAGLAAIASALKEGAIDAGASKPTVASASAPAKGPSAADGGGGSVAIYIVIGAVVVTAFLVLGRRTKRQGGA